MSKVMHYGLYAKKQRSYFRWGFSFLGFPVCWRGFLVNMYPFLSDPSLLLGPLEGEISKVHFLCGRFYLGRVTQWTLFIHTRLFGGTVLVQPLYAHDQGS